MKNQLVISLFLGWLLLGTNTFATPSITKFLRTPTITQFAGGINQPDAHACRLHLEAAKCKLKTMLTEYKHCVQSILGKYPTCRQTLAFFHTTNGGLIKIIRSYQHVDVIFADYGYIADQGTGYFIVTPSGQLLSLPLSFSRKILRRAPGYQAIAKKYPRVNLWSIQGFPTLQKIPPRRYRLIFIQQLKDGCDACALAGTAKVAYDFSNDGKTFYGAKIIDLIPRKQP